MTLAYRSDGAFADANSTTTGAVGLPAGLANGDVMVMVVQARGTSGTITTPAGWTQPSGLPVIRSSSFRTTVFYRYVANAGAEVAPSVTQTVSGAIRARITALSGGSSTTVLDVAVEAADGGAVTTVDAPSITPVSGAAMVLWIFSTNDDTTLDAATQGTTAYSSNGTAGADGSIALVYELQGTPAGPSGICTMTNSTNAPASYNVITVALRPAAVVATAPATAFFDDILFDVDVAFGAGPFTPSPTWTRVTEYVSAAHSITVNTGRQSEDAATNPGTLSLVLNNSITQTGGRRFDPDYTAGPYYGLLNLRTPIRVWARRDSTNHPLFTGHVTSWRQVQVAGSKDSVVEVSAVDFTALLANTPCPSSGLALRLLSDRPEVYVPMDEEELGNIKDLSGNAWTGAYPTLVTIPDTIVPGQPGKKAKAITTVGAGVPDGTIGYMAASTTPENIRAVEAWVKVSAYDSATVDVTGTVTPFAITAFGVSNGLRLQARVVDTGLARQFLWWSQVIDSAGTVVDGWTDTFTLGLAAHVALVLAADGSDLRLYVNGQLAGAAGVSGSSFEGGSLDPGLHIGVTSDESAATVAHVAAYQTALTPEEVTLHYLAGVIGGRLQTAAERLELLAEYAGVTDAELLDTSLMGTHTFLAETDFSGSVLDEMRKIVEADQGRMFVDGEGVLTFHSRITDIEPGDGTHVTSQGSYGDDATTEIRYEDFHREPESEEMLQNIVTVNGTEQRDADSVSQYGPRSADYSVPIASPYAARAFGQSKLDRYATPEPRVDQIVVNLRGHLSAELDTAQNTTLGLRLGYRITATIRPADGLGTDIVEAVRVEGIRDVIDRHGWVRDLYTVPAGDAYNEGPFFTIGHATYGRIGTPAGNKFPG